MPERATPRVDRPRMPKEYGVPKSGGALVPWSHVEQRLAEATVYWMSTSGPGGKPRVRPLDGIYLDGVLYVGGSPETRWARDIAANPQVAVHLDGGMDAVILEGEAELLEPPPRRPATGAGRVRSARGRPQGRPKAVSRAAAAAPSGGGRAPAR